MTLELTLGRTTFMIRREPAKRTDLTETYSPDRNTFVQAWMQIFNGTWEAKAGACFPEQFSVQHGATKKEDIDG